VEFQFISGNLGRNAGQSLPLYRFDISVMKAFKIPRWESSRLELKLDVFNVFNHALFILNNANDSLTFLALPSLTAKNFNCPASCINPFTGLYLGANGTPLNIKDFQRASFNASQNFAGLGGPSATVTPRIMQLAIRFRW
jgi:hypothetical protein